jgi:hypothetical protein
MEIILTAGGMSALIVEGIKWLVRYFKSNPDYNLPASFYLVILPVLNVLVIPLLALIGVSGYSMPTDWVGFLRTVIQVLLSSMIAVFGYTNAIKPLKVYKERQEFESHLPLG